MFRFLELELHGWDFWPPTRVPLDAGVVILSGPNGSGKTTMLDAIRQILNAQRLSQNRRLSHYLRTPNQPALVRAVVSNKTDKRGRRPFEAQRVFTDEATLACAIVPDGGTPEKRFAVLPGRPGAAELQNLLLETRDWMPPDQYRRLLERAGVSRSLMHILALEQGRVDELSRKSPRDLFRWVMEARGSQHVLERYSSARMRYQDSLTEVARQQQQLVRHEADLKRLERLVRRLDEHESRLRRLAAAEALVIGARLQSKLSASRDIERKLPELRTKIANLTTATDRLRRDRAELESGLKLLEENVTSRRFRFEEATTERDRCTVNWTLAEQQLRTIREAVAELQNLATDNMELLVAKIEQVRQERFHASQQVAGCRNRLDVLKGRISQLEQGIPVFPDSVHATLESLEQEGIPFVLAATSVEIEDSSWVPSVESALGPLRYALCLAPEHLPKAISIAHQHGFPGPLATDRATGPSANGPVCVSAGAPAWLTQWLRQTRFTEGNGSEDRGGDRILHMSGLRRDEYGAWVFEVTDYVLGGNAMRIQLDQAKIELLGVERELDALTESHRKIAAEEAPLEARIDTQRKRMALEQMASRLPAAEAAFQSAESALAEARTAWQESDRGRVDAERLLDSSKVRLTHTAKDLEDRQKELDGTVAAVSNMDGDLSRLQEEIAALVTLASPEIRERAEAGALKASPEMAEQDVDETRSSLERFLKEEPLPEPTVRDEHKLTLRNIHELEQHVSARQREANAAKSELDHCRGEYLQVIASVLHDYRRRAGALAEIARAKLEIELPGLENTDKSIDEAGIIVRIGFDGKTPTEIGDTAHSGGQQVIAGLILLMAMAETEGDSFFIVDEPFAHLSLDRIDEVGRFLRGSGSQFLITVPTTLDRGQLDPASLLVVLSKKSANENLAPRPIVARV